jgi:hypothetical protein
MSEFGPKYPPLFTMNEIVTKDDTAALGDYGMVSFTFSPYQ